MTVQSRLELRPSVQARRPVAFLLPSLAGGGGERVTLALAREVAARGLPVDLVVGQASGALREEVPATVRLVDLRQPRMLSALVPLVRYLRRTRPTHLLPTLEHANVAAILAAPLARSGTRVVIRVVNTLSVFAAAGGSRRERLALAAARRLYGRADEVVACSAGVADDLAVHCSIPRRRIQVLAHGPMVPREVHELAAERLDHPWFRPGEPPVVLGVGRLSGQKNFPMLLEAVARVRRQRPVRLLLLGTGPDRAALEEQATGLGVRADVDVVGFDRNPYRYMARAAVFALSSDFEGLPGALIEAVACGCSVVATDCPSGPREILDGGRLGRLVPVGDAAAFAAALLATLAEPRRDEAGAMARYTAEGVTDAYLDLIGRTVP